MDKREIKFRVWDGEQMHKVDASWEGEWETGLSYGYMLEVTSERPDPDEWEWLRYTGLTDAENQEIYEGDVVTRVAGSQDQVEQVKWQHASIWPFRSGRGDEWHADECRIIGNIFQNPKLM